MQGQSQETQKKPKSLVSYKKNRVFNSQKLILRDFSFVLFFMNVLLFCFKGNKLTVLKQLLFFLLCLLKKILSVSVINRKSNSSFSVPFLIFLHFQQFWVPFGIFLSLSQLPGSFFFNFIFRMFSQDSEKVCFMTFILTCSGDISQCFMPCTFFIKIKTVYVLVV